MSEIGDTFEGFAEASKLRRAANRENSALILAEHGIFHESPNGGVHLIVKHGVKVVDFWPGTGLWIARKPHYHKARGIFPLIKFLGVRK